MSPENILHTIITLLISGSFFLIGFKKKDDIFIGLGILTFCFCMIIVLKGIYNL